MRDDPSDRWRQRPQPLVIARLLGQIREQVRKPPARQREELPIIGDREEHLRDRERDELGVGDLRGMTRTTAFGQEIVHAHIKCSEQSVEVGEHKTTSMVDVAIATPTFGALVMSPCGNPRRTNTESTI